MAAKNYRPGRTLGILGVGIVILYVLAYVAGTVGLPADNNPWKPRLGLDLEGGTRITLTALGDSKDITPEKLRQAAGIVESRANGSGVSEATVATQGNKNIVVEIPGKNAQNLVDSVKRTAQLRFRLVAGQPQPGTAAPSSAASPSVQPGSVVTVKHAINPRGGKVTPTTGAMPSTIATLTMTCQKVIAATPRHTVQSFARIQSDVVSGAMREVLPRMLAVPPSSERARAAQALLSKWDHAMSVDRPEPLIAAAWWREFTRRLYADELGDAFATNWLLRPQFVAAALGGGPEARWCDDVRTPAAEPCEKLVADALDAALAELSKRYGEDMAAWRWGTAHVARHEHRPFGRHPQLSKIFDIVEPSPGDAFTVNVGRHNLNDPVNPYANRHAASLRAIYDLADLEGSLFIHSGGQSGNVLSPHYRSFTEAWAKGEYIPMKTARAAIAAAPHAALRLEPQRR